MNRRDLGLVRLLIAHSRTADQAAACRPGVAPVRPQARHDQPRAEVDKIGRARPAQCLQCLGIGLQQGRDTQHEQPDLHGSDHEDHADDGQQGDLPPLPDSARKDQHHVRAGRYFEKEQGDHEGQERL